MAEKILLISGIIMVILTVLFITFCILKRKDIDVNSTVGKKLGRIILSVLLIVVTCGNFVAMRYTNLINQYFTTIDLNDSAIQKVREESTKTAKELADEGFVLLKNDSKVLPLAGNKVNVFGYSSIDINFGGTGSGGGGDEYNVSFYEGLANAGIEVNEELKAFYESAYTAKQDTNALVMVGGDYNNYEPAVSEYKDSMVESAVEFSDTALVVITRNGGEGGDLPMDTADYVGGAKGEHYLELNKNEREMLALVEDKFENVVVIINSSNAMELGFIDDAAVDAALWIGGPGCEGCESLGEIITGKINPSGRLADTYAYDLTTNPSYYNFGQFLYKNTDNKYQLIFDNPSVFNGENYAYVDYAEGIYVGYRYYETRWIDNETNECDEEAYKANVQFPFGYGLSYTTFDQTISNFSDDGDNINVEVTVTNTGDVAGKDVVQLYYTAPYTVGGIEKSFVNLLDFGKTQMLNPGESETISFAFKYEDMASYDYTGKGCYVLEQGEYAIKLMNNAHELIDSKNVTVAADVVYDESNPRSTDEIAAVNQFDDVSYGNDITYVSRSDWENTLPTERPANKNASKDLIYEIENQGLTEEQLAEEAEDIVVANHGLTIDDMKGVDYDDAKWEQLLEQLSVDDMVNLIANGGYATAAVESIGKYATMDEDGPQGINSLISGDVKGVVFPSEVVVASTFNKELAKDMGQALGNEAAEYGIAGLYGPAMNTHRSPFGGRCYEYYSEDGVLAGEIAAAFVKGANEVGIYCYMKHFALDEQETERLDISIFCNEQAMRELYFKPFEICAKKGGCTAVMASDSFIGGTWAGEREELMNTVLRGEWGFDGMVITDFVTSNSKDADRAIRSGTDLSLTTLGNLTPSGLSTDSNAGRQALRTACHNILYTIANSNAQGISKEPFPLWALLFSGVYALLFAGVCFITIKKKTEITISEE
ncbi:MAG: glycoside hydrolase family 3 C-terminal domain-containing protein [Pseudobutyrivibrio sp.]|nr:glycoside hydrolase family 3 C-terminal domain-containing protein [Pseudobutyrivibrio sp.]